MIQLYPYQQTITDQIREGWAAGLRRMLVQSPTGSGKTIMFSWIAQQTAARGKKILILTHRIELLTETGGTLRELSLDSDLVTAGTSKPPRELVSIAMTATLRNRLKTQLWRDWFDTLDLIIIDEAHQQDFDWVFEFITTQYVLGFTATPKRKGGQKQLSEMYQRLISGLDVQQLINLGFLVTDRYYGAPVNLKGVSRDASGEYKTDELFKRFDRPELYSGVVDNWRRLTPGTQALVFCVNIQHCISTARAFNDAGITAKFITSEVQRPDPDSIGYEGKLAAYENYQSAFRKLSGERGDVIGEWERREYLVLINAGILTTGYNWKPIETVVVNRATTSVNLWSQIIGRGSRTSEGKQYFNILDFGGNADRLGHYRQQREYSLTHYTSTRKDGVQSVKDCPQCGALVIASTRLCKYCGYVFPKSRKEVAVELVQKTFEELQSGEAIRQMRTIEDIEAAAQVRGYKKAWIWRQIYSKLGTEEFKRYMRSRNYQQGFIYRLIGNYNGSVRSMRPTV
jgi:superfamily II DNA or RNA helicase